MPTSHAGRTYAVTGAASGIGAAVVAALRGAGARVIACDLTEGDVLADLATPDGRAALTRGVGRLCDDRLDGVVANAGGGRPETLLSLNFFGAVATLEGLRPLLAPSGAGRAVAISSISALDDPDPTLVAACLAGDEAAANRAGWAAHRAGAGPLQVYGAAKHALNRWCRQAASGPAWAGAGIALNVVAPGVTDTPAAAYILSDVAATAQMRARCPLKGGYPGRPEDVAALVAWCLSAQNRLMTGQVLFADAGFECAARGELVW